MRNFGVPSHTCASILEGVEVMLGPDSHFMTALLSVNHDKKVVAADGRHRYFHGVNTGAVTAVMLILQFLPRQKLPEQTSRNQRITRVQNQHFIISLPGHVRQLRQKLATSSPELALTL